MSAILIATLPGAGTGFPPDRFVEAIIGGGVALAVSVLLFPPDPALLVEESVTAIVQVDGKVRDRLEVSPKITADELEVLARASAGVARAIGEREIVNVIVRAPRLVNIATRG